MRIEKGQPVPQPDTIIYEEEDYLPDFPSLCAECLTAFSRAANDIRLADRQYGRSKEALGKRVVFPNGSSIEWNANRSSIPAGYDFIIEVIRIMGTSVRLTCNGGNPLPLFAVTTRDGTACCAFCASIKKH